MAPGSNCVIIKNDRKKLIKFLKSNNIKPLENKSIRNKNY